LATVTVFTDSVPGLPCKVQTCPGGTRKTAGYCSRHYGRLRKYGDPLAGGRVRPRYASPEEEFLGQTKLTEHGLLWFGPLHVPHNYGRMRNKKYAHRYAWERSNAQISAGYVIDHDPNCPKMCVDIRHLSLYTISDHIRVGWQRGEQDGGWPRRAPSAQDPVTGRFIKC
jgi:hypothetical protein